MSIEATTLTAGQTFSTKYDNLTALEAPKVDRHSISGGYKILCKDQSGEEIYYLFTATDMVNAY